MFYKLFLLLLLSPVLALSQARINKVNFLQEGEISKLVIETESEVIAEKFQVVDSKQIFLDLKGVVGDSKTLRPIDTSEFSGGTVYVSAFQKQNSSNEVRFAVQLRDNVQSRLEIRNNKVILSIENRFGVFAESGINTETVNNLSDNSQSFDPETATISDVLENLVQSGNKKYIGKRISISVKKLALSEILNMIADTSGFNIVVDNSVTSRPPMTITLTNTPWDEVLDTVMKLNRLVAKKHANILQIKTEEDYIKERQSELDAQNKLKSKDPIVTKVFSISFGTLADMVKVIKEYASERGGVIQDERTNKLIVKDTAENIQKISKVIKLLDTPTPQVLIEAKIVEAEEDTTLNLGFQDGGFSGNYRFTGTPSANDATFSLSPSPTATTGVFGAAINVFRRIEDLNFKIDLLEANSKAEIISAPRVVTQNKQAAQISTNRSIQIENITVNNGITSVGFQALNANLSLDVTPQVSNDGSIALQIAMSKGDFSPSPGDAPPGTTTNNINTTVLVDNGSTVVIGGLYIANKANSEKGIPFLKDIPLLGWLFKSGVSEVKSRRELIVFLTPRILNKSSSSIRSEVL